MPVKLPEDRDLQLRLAMVALTLWIMVAPLVHAEPFEGCSWPGPTSDWMLERILPAVDLAGTLGSEVLDFLHKSGIPISFISGSGNDPEVRIQRMEATTVRELIDEAMLQTPGYRRDFVDGKLVIYPLDGEYDSLVDIGDFGEARRGAALFSVLRELRSASPALSSLRMPTLRGPSAGVYGDRISFGGSRSIVEHLVSLVSGRPSVAFVISLQEGRSKIFSFAWAEVIAELLLEAPKRVDVGAEFQAVPRVILVDGTPLTLIGSGCGVQFDADSVLRIDQSGHATALTKGTAWIQAKYEARTVYVEVEVGDV